MGMEASALNINALFFFSFLPYFKTIMRGRKEAPPLRGEVFGENKGAGGRVSCHN